MRELNILTLVFISLRAQGSQTNPLCKLVGTDTTYGYDQTGQLLTSKHSSATTQNENFVYDANGNRLSTGSQSTKNTVGASNRILTDATYTYSYDDEGNLVLKTETATGKIWRYLYDHRNRLTEATEFGTNSSVLSANDYTYDLLDRRIAKTVNSATTQFFYEGDNLWRQVDSAANTTRYLTGGAVDNWLARSNSELRCRR